MNNYVSYIDLPDAGQQYLRSINKRRAYGIIEECKTHGRGLEEVQRLIWLYLRPTFAHIKSQLNNLFKSTSKDIIKA